MGIGRWAQAPWKSCTSLLSLQGNHGDHRGTEWPLGTLISSAFLRCTSHQGRDLVCSTERNSEGWEPVAVAHVHTCLPEPSTSGSRWNLLSLIVDKNPTSQGSVTLPPPTGKYQQHPTLLNPAFQLAGQGEEKRGQRGEDEANMSLLLGRILEVHSGTVFDPLTMSVLT